MSKTIEAIMTKPRTVLAKDVELSAQWQTGFAMSFGYAQRKLHLSFAPSPFNPISKHDCYAGVRT